MNPFTPIPYPGGKSAAGAYQTIINLMPPHTWYIEPFLGGGAIWALKRPAAYNLAGDLDAAVVERWRVKAQELTAGSGGVAGTTAKPDGTAPFSLPFTVFQFPMGAWSRIAWGDGVTMINWAAASIPRTTPTVIYCDPPYLMETRSGRRLYKHEMSPNDHEVLLWAILKSPHRVILSGYLSDLYTQMLKGWNTITYQAMTRGGKPATEYLWFNFEPPKELHDWRFLGKDYRERERIKKKRNRWAARLSKMDELERGAILGALQEVWG